MELLEVSPKNHPPSMVYHDVLDRLPPELLRRADEQYQRSLDELLHSETAATKLIAEARRMFRHDQDCMVAFKAAQSECGRRVNELDIEQELAAKYTENEMFDHALPLLVPAAARKHPRALAMLGLMYMNGNKVTKDPDKAQEYYSELVEMAMRDGDDPEVIVAQCAYGWMLFHGNGAPRNRDKACEFFKKSSMKGMLRGIRNYGCVYRFSGNHEEGKKWCALAAVLGYTGAQTDLSHIYMRGQGVGVDKERGAQWALLSARSGTCCALNDLGEIYKYGHGIQADDSIAVAHFARAAACGCPRAVCNLAIMYDNGRGVPVDDTEAARLYRFAAERGIASAQCNMGLMLEYGEGVTADPEEAVRYYEKAVALEHSSGYFHLGRAYEKGMGVEQDYANAYRLYTIAAEKGRITALYRAACMLESGKGVVPNVRMALEMFLKVAERGNWSGCVSAALMFAEGRGCKRDLDRAWNLFLKAAESGSSVAQTNLGTMCANGIGRDHDFKDAMNWFCKAADNPSPAPPAIKHVTRAKQLHDAIRSKVEPAVLSRKVMRRPFILYWADPDTQQLAVHVGSKVDHCAVLHCIADNVPAWDLMYFANAKDCEGNTPLHLSCKVGCAECVQELLNWHASIDCLNNKSEYALDCLPKGVEFRLKYSTPWSPSTHRWFNRELKQAIATTMLVLRTRFHAIPIELVLAIISLLVQETNWMKQLQQEAEEERSRQEEERSRQEQTANTEPPG